MSKNRVKLLDRFGIKLTTGCDIDPICYMELDWIRYKDIFIQVLKDPDSDKYSIAWQDYAPDHFRIDEMLITTPIKQEKK